MNRPPRIVVAGAAGALALVVAAAFLLGGGGPADGSTLSRAGGGWLAARRYLEARGTGVTLLDRPLEDGIGARVLVVVFPWQGAGLDDPAGAIERHLQTGGAVLFAYAASEDPNEPPVRAALGLERAPAFHRASLVPWRWRRDASEEWALTVPPGREARPGRVRAVRRLLVPPRSARMLLFGPDARPVAFTYRRWSGRVAVLPAEAFANARLGVPGNADLLEAVRAELGGPWAFDEFHHGLRAPEAAGEGTGGNTLVLFLLQLAFVYLLAALAVSRRFGPAWRDPEVTSGSAAAFLVGLGALHRRLGHHREAARRLVARARELDPRLVLPEGAAEDERTFLGLARHVGRVQAGGSA